MKERIEGIIRSYLKDVIVNEKVFDNMVTDIIKEVKRSWPSKS